jgi:hypothetical protein
MRQGNSADRRRLSVSDTCFNNLRNRPSGSAIPFLPWPLGTGSHGVEARRGFSADSLPPSLYTVCSSRLQTNSIRVDGYMFLRTTFRRILTEMSPVALACAGGLMLSGCGGSSATPEASTDTPTNAEPGQQTASATAGSTAEKPTETASTSKAGRKRDEVWVDENGQKWFGNVPMDAFFDNAYEVASNQQSVGGAGVAVADAGSATEPEMTPDASTESDTTAAPVADSPKPATETATSEAGGEDSWSTLITAATIDEEVKSIRNFLNENVHSVGTFNSSMLMIPPKAASLAAVAVIVMEHPESVPWKDDAKYVRDLAKKMNASVLQRGAKDQKRIEELYDAVDATLSRSKPAGLEEPPESDSFSEVAEMRLLMMRMEEAEKRLKTEAGNESTMGENKAMVAHEASIMAVMAKIVAMPAYGYGDDPKFTGYANEVLKASQDIKTAAESGDFAAYESALTRVSTTCSNCHSDFKND